MKKTTMKKYARLIAVTGANVQKGQEVMVYASVENAEFARMVAEECYRAGAKKVIVEWSYQPLDKTNYRYRTLKTLSTVEKWEIARLEHRAETLPAMIYLESDDPDGMAGINQQKMAKARQATYPIVKPFRDRMDNKYQWVIAAVPGEKWAKKMFPGVSRNQAIEKLWEAILYTARADGEDPIADWAAHNADLAARSKYLNDLDIDELRYHSSNGTDLRVGLIKNVNFLGGGENTLGGVYYNPNMPTEEVFTSPMRGNADGTVVATRPLSYLGQLIENFSVRFENGKAVEVHAEKNEELLRQMISMDDGAAYLGECALVPYDSPIQNSGLIFYNTLFDENACCHLALGRGFPECIKNYAELSMDECHEMGINDSMIHVDFMIGSEDLEITAHTRDGREVAIFKNGNWAF